VLAITVYNDRLVAGGLFSEIGGVAADNIAAWNGSRWEPLGSGLPATAGAAVYSLAVHEGALVAGGRFGSISSTVAQWDGATWTSKGTLSGIVLSLASANGVLFAGGSFLRAAAPQSLDGIVRWDGSGWSELGSGTNQAVRALAPLNGSLYMGGDFTQAGGHSSFGIARWDGLPGPSAPEFMFAAGVPNPFRGVASFAYTIRSAGRMRVAVYDAAGRQVAVLVDGDRPAGPHTATWNGRDTRGVAVSSGVYFVSALFPDGTAQTRKTVRLK
jgi:hypothetical protein